MIKAKLVAKFLEIARRTDIPIGIGPSENRKKGKQYRWIKDYKLSEYSGSVYENGMEVLCSTIIDSPISVSKITGIFLLLKFLTVFCFSFHD
ncbi:hypothetical protein ES703_60237 [subsurface metagenome]